MATQIDVPADVCDRPLGDVKCAIRPLSLENMESRGHWDLKLEEAVRDALENSKVIRSLGGALSSPQSFVAPTGPYQAARRRASRSKRTSCPRSTIRRWPRAARSAGDHRAPGVEAALSLFNAQWATSLVWNRNHTPQTSRRRLMRSPPSARWISWKRRGNSRRR